MSPPVPAALGYLVLTVAFETFGTACIQASQQFSRVWPSLGVLVGYALSFWFLSQALRTLPLGIAYATWSGLGVVNITVVGYVVFGQRIDAPGLVGLALVCAGIVVMHGVSGAARP
jgi:small multidrug resistance pump